MELIGGSKEVGIKGRGYMRSKFFHFHAVFGKNLQNNRLTHQIWELTPSSLRKTLDPPLARVNDTYVQLSFCTLSTQMHIVHVICMLSAHVHIIGLSSLTPLVYPIIQNLVSAYCLHTCTLSMSSACCLHMYTSYACHL